MEIEWDDRRADWDFYSSFTGKFYEYTYKSRTETLCLTRVEDGLSFYMVDIIKSKAHAERIIRAIEGDE